MTDDKPKVIVLEKRRRTALGSAVAVVGVVLSVLFMLNLTFGILEIPDVLPIVGNLDEGAAMVVMLSCLRYLGLDLVLFGPRRKKGFDADKR